MLLMKKEAHQAMICKKCGTFNENYLEYCKNCASELIPEGDEARPETPSASEERAKPTWGFVRSPGWPNPDLSADNVNEEDIPKGYSPRRFDPKPINDDYVPVNRPAPSPEPEEMYDYDYEDDIEPFDDEDPDKTMVIPVRRGSHRGASARAENNRTPNKESRRPDQQDRNQIRYADPLDEDYFYDGDEDDDNDDYRPRGKRRGLAVVLAVIGVVVVTLIVIGIITIGSNYGSLGNFTAHVFGGNPLMRSSTIATGTDPNGKPIYTVTIYAESGSKVRFKYGSDEREDEIDSSNSISYNVAREVWYPTQPVDESPVMIEPDFTLITESGEEFKIDKFVTTDESIINVVKPDATDKERKNGIELTSVPIEVPTISLTLTSPDTATMTSASKSVLIEGTVDDTAAAVYINGQLTTVDGTGKFSYTYELPGAGTHEITVEAQKAGCKTAKATVSVDYSVANSELKLDSGVNLRTNGETITIKGTVDPGSQIEVSGDGIELTAPATVDESGAFTFTAKLSSVGYYNAAVTITNNGTTSTASLHLERAPASSSDYKAGAFALDYDRLVSSPNHDQSYAINGKVTEVIQSEGYTIAKLTLADGKELYFEYHNSYEGAATISAGDNITYTIAGFPNGLYGDTNIPYIYVWFVWKTTA